MDTISKADYQAVVCGLQLQNRINIEEMQSAMKSMQESYTDSYQALVEENKKLLVIIAKLSKKLRKARNKTKVKTKKVLISDKTINQKLS
jgi:hypothetical protein